MRKTFSILGWLTAVLTFISLILTIITTNNIALKAYITGFSTYFILQVCIFFMMLIWAYNLHVMSSGRRKYIYPAICLFFALGVVILRYVFAVA